MANRQEIKRILREFPSLRGLLKWRTATGCLEYRGPKRGRVEGNPYVYSRRDHTALLLRTRIWHMHRGSLPKGKYVHMRCENHRCHNIRHMQVVSKVSMYRPRKASPSDRFSARDVNTIRYYFRRAPTKVLAEIFGVSAGLILRIQRGQSNSDIRMPKSFLPDPSVSRKVERKTFQCMRGLALHPRHVTQIKKDLRRCPLSERDRDILLRITQGERVPRLAKEYRITRQHIYQIRKEALVRIWRTLGPRIWIRQESKGKIEKWVRTYPKPKRRAGGAGK